jgi:dCTP deaminase
MILSDLEILRRLKEGSLVVEPFNPEDLTPNGLDFRLGEELMDLEGGSKLPLREEVLLKPNHRYLAVTVQRVQMPLDLIAIVSLRSTWARLGFQIPTTVVDAGYKGRLTLAFTTGAEPVRVKMGAKIWHLIFMECYPSSGYKGKYQGSEGLKPADLSTES